MLADAASGPQSEPPSDAGELRFDDPKAAFAAHSNAQILRSLAVFTVCGIKPLVKYADTCLRVAKRIVGATLVNAVVKRTFFKHFCAGGRVAAMGGHRVGYNIQSLAHRV